MRLIGRAVLLTTLLTPAVVSAQYVERAGFPIERLQPTTDKEGIIDIEAPDVGDHLNLDIGLWLGYAFEPFILLEQQADGSYEEVAGLVKHRLGGNLTAAIGLFGVFRVGADLPFILFQGRDLGDAKNTIDSKDVGSVGIGDLRLVPKLQLLRHEDSVVDASILSDITFPTGAPRNSYIGEKSITWAPRIAVAKPFGPLVVATNVGYRLRKKTRTYGFAVNDEITYRLGASYDLSDLLQEPLEVEASLSGQTAADDPFGDVSTTPLELLLAGAYDITQDIQTFIGGGLGLTAGYGSPTFRVFGGVRFAPRERDRDGDGVLDENDKCVDDPEDLDGFEDADGCPDLDNDGDGILDDVDAAPNDPEDKDNFEDEDGKPDPDNDQDGLLDAVDRCPNEAEDIDGFEDEDGCPDLDNDQDQILDVDDVCPNEAEDIDGYEDEDGCPDPDNDNDGILDRDDKCPLQAEVINGIDDEDGCPDKGKTMVKVTREKIEILEKVFFDSGKATIKERSYNLLSQVAAILKANAYITKIQIEGHTDDRGSEAGNLLLSKDRAAAVMKFIVDKGLEEIRIVAEGFGEAKPIASNKSRRGRAENRRVEFVILEIDGKPAGEDWSKEVEVDADQVDLPAASDKPAKSAGDASESPLQPLPTQ